MGRPNIYPVCDLLEHVKEWVLQTQSCKISMAQGNSRITNSGTSEGPASIVPLFVCLLETPPNPHGEAQPNSHALTKRKRCHTTTLKVVNLEKGQVSGGEDISREER